MKSKLRRLVIYIFSVTLILILLTIGLAIAQEATKLTRITMSSAGNRDSFNPSLSADGTLVAFNSNSDLLNQGVSSGTTEIWLYNTTTLTLTRITTAAESTSQNPDLSADGRVIAFESNADFLGEGLPTTTTEIWLYDTGTLTYTRITSATDASSVSRNPRLSANGNIVVFESSADLRAEGLPTTTTEIWLYNRVLDTLARITKASDNSRISQNPSVNANGTLIAFESDSDLLGQGLSAGIFEIWLYNTATLTFTRVTTASAITRDSTEPSLSADGKQLAFVSDSRFQGQGNNPENQFEIYLYNVDRKRISRLTVAPDNSRDSSKPSLNSNGTKVAFESDVDLQNEGVLDEQFEIWVYDTTSQVPTRITRTSGSGRASLDPTLNGDGTLIAFESDSNFLNENIGQGQFQIWLSESPRVYLPVVIK